MRFRVLPSDFGRVVLNSASPEQRAKFSRAVHVFAKQRGFRWDGVFWQRIPGPGPNGTLGSLKPWDTGPFPDFLIMQFSSRTVSSPDGDRMAVVEPWQTVDAAIERMVSGLTPQKQKNPFRVRIGQDFE